MTKVLVIDDEAPIRLLCRVNLEAEGMNVLEAEDGPSGIEKARAEQPDVILLDVMMPQLDGWQVAERLLDEERIAVMPGSSFGPTSAGHVRVAMTVEDRAYEDALRRLVALAARIAAERA